MPFLDPEKKLFVIDDVEFPIRENVKGVEMKALRDMQRSVITMHKAGKEPDAIEELDFEMKWFEEVSKVAFNLSFEELLEKISEPDARQLLGEAYAFLLKFGTIERLLAYEGALAEMSKNAEKLSDSTPN